DDLLVLAVDAHEIARRRHLEVGEVEAGRDRAAAERPLGARREPRGLPHAGRYYVRGLAVQEVAGDHVTRVAVLRVDRVQLQRSPRIQVPDLVAPAHAVKRGEVSRAEQEIDERAAAPARVVARVDARMLNLERRPIHLAVVAAFGMRNQLESLDDLSD